MQRFNTLLATSAIVLLAPVMVMAQGLADGPSAGGLQTLMSNVLAFTNTVLIPFIIGIGFLFFVWGMFKFFIAGGANEDEREKGKQLMIYATLGFLLIIIFWGVVNLFVSATGLEGESLQTPPRVPTIPTAS